MPDSRHSAEAPTRSPRKPSVHFGALRGGSNPPSFPSSPTASRRGEGPGPASIGAGNDVFGSGVTKGVTNPDWERNDYARGTAQGFGGKTTATHGVLPTAATTAKIDIPEWEKETYVRGIAQQFEGRDTESHGILPGAVGKILEPERIKGIGATPDERGWGGFKGMDTYSNLPLPGPGGHLPPTAEPHLILRMVANARIQLLNLGPAPSASRAASRR